MRRIPFRAEFVEPILLGTKTTTIRRRNGVLPKPGDRVAFTCRRRQFAAAEIMALMPVELDNLKNQDARSDGHESADSLRAALRRLYGGAPLTRVRFRLLRPADAY